MIVLNFDFHIHDDYRIFFGCRRHLEVVFFFRAVIFNDKNSVWSSGCWLGQYTGCSYHSSFHCQNHCWTIIIKSMVNWEIRVLCSLTMTWDNPSLKGPYFPALFLFRPFFHHTNSYGNNFKSESCKVWLRGK